MKTKRVFVVQESTDRDGARSVDLSPAQKFGTLVFLNPSDMLPQDWAPAVKRMWELLNDFGDDDFLLPAGRGAGGDIAKGIAMAIAASVNNGQVQLLRWNSKRRDYDPVTITIWERVDIPDKVMEAFHEQG